MKYILNSTRMKTSAKLRAIIITNEITTPSNKWTFEKQYSSQPGVKQCLRFSDSVWPNAFVWLPVNGKISCL